jgi:hypothetical protein
MNAIQFTKDAEMYVTYPDGSKQPLLRTDRAAYNEGGSTANNIEQIVFVPVNEGQTQVEIEFNLDKSTGEGFGFEIIGAMCTRRIELSPEVDYIQIVGSQNSSQRNQGYIDASTNSFNNDTDIWTSETPGTSPATDPSDPTLGQYNEEIDHITITVDWNEQAIFGTYLWNAEVEGTGFLYANDLVGEKTFTISEFAAEVNFTTTIKFEVSGRTIVKLPCPDHNNQYDNKGQNYTIENYKTIASTTRRLETGFTILATNQLATDAAPISGTVDTDGYLIVTANFTGAQQDDFAVDIAGTVFENNNHGNSSGLSLRETVTLPIAASETYSITSNEGTTFTVRFKAKSTELSDSNSFNLIDSGVTGSFSSNTTFQELDLSHVVGANKTLVVLEVFGGTDTGIDRPTNTAIGHTLGDESADGVYFRQNNSSIIQPGGTNTNFSALTGGTSSALIDPLGGGGVVTVMTDVTGKVEQRSTFGGTVYYKVQAYQGIVSPSIPAGFQNASLTVNGYQVLPGGLIMQWGEYTDADIAHGEDFSVTFPIPFPNALLQLNGQPNDNAVDVTNNNMAAYQRFITSDTSGFTAEVGSDGGGSMNMTFQWNALGH